MSSTGVRDSSSTEKRVIKGLILNEAQFIQSLRVFANSSTLSGLGATGGDSNNSPLEASGNYFSKSGDILLGQFGNSFDTIAATELVSGTLDVSKSTGSTFPVIILQGEGLADDDLVNITEGEDVFAFQELWIRTRINIITVKNSGNVNTADGEDLVLPAGSIIKLLFDTFLGEWVIVAGNAVTGSGGTTGTFISADLTADQITNLAVGEHIEFDRNATPTGADGGIVLQTGAGQANGIFELKAGKTYFLSGGVAPFFGATNHVEFVWFDITNAIEIGRRTIQDDAILALDQPKAEINFTPETDVNVELRLVANTTPANLNGYDADHTFAHIFEFSGKNGADGAPGTSGAVTWKTPARAKTVADIPVLASFDVITDGVTLVENDRVLLTEQATASENGLYVVGVVAGGLAPLTRPTDFDTDAEVLSETFVAIEEGSQFANQLYHLISNNPLLIDVSDQVWQEIGGAQAVGPNLGQDNQGFDASGQFVFDGRISTASFVTQLWESKFSANLGDGSVGRLFWIPPLGEDAGRIVTIGSESGPGIIAFAFSDDLAETFTSAGNSGENASFGPVAYDPTGRLPRIAGSNEGILVIAQSGGSTENVNSNLKISTNRGESYSIVVSPNTDIHRDLIFAQPPAAAGQFVISNAHTTPDDAGLRGIWTSPDGTNWTIRTTPAPLGVFQQWSFLAYSPSLNLYICTTLGSTVDLLDIITSSDGINWTLQASNVVLNPVQALLWSEGQQKFVMITRGNPSGGFLFSNTSVDGINWETHLIATSFGDNFVASDLVFAENLSTYVLSGARTTDGWRFTKFWVSQDAISWTEVARQPLFTSTAVMGSIIFAPEYTKFFAADTTLESQNVWRTTR